MLSEFCQNQTWIFSYFQLSCNSKWWNDFKIINYRIVTELWVIFEIIPCFFNFIIGLILLDFYSENITTHVQAPFRLTRTYHTTTIPKICSSRCPRSTWKWDESFSKTKYWLTFDPYYSSYGDLALPSWFLNCIEKMVF